MRYHNPYALRSPSELIPEGIEWRHLDPILLDEKGELRVLPAADFLAIPRLELRLWCHHRAVYQLPTLELVDWLRDRIGGRSAIEIGSGNGGFARALGIPATDNKMQEWPHIRATYFATGQPTIRYGANVEKIDALDAVDKYRPKVVLGCWVTQYVSPFVTPRQGEEANQYGIKESQILDLRGSEGRVVKSYIVVGNDQIHGSKRIRERPFQTLRFPWLVTRSAEPETNAIYVWEQR